jgi:hypothetical protein
LCIGFLHEGFRQLLLLLMMMMMMMSHSRHFRERISSSHAALIAADKYRKTCRILATVRGGKSSPFQPMEASRRVL